MNDSTGVKKDFQSAEKYSYGGYFPNLNSGQKTYILLSEPEWAAMSFSVRPDIREYHLQVSLPHLTKRFITSLKHEAEAGNLTLKIEMTCRDVLQHILKNPDIFEMLCKVLEENNIALILSSVPCESLKVLNFEPVNRSEMKLLLPASADSMTIEEMAALKNDIAALKAGRIIFSGITGKEQLMFGLRLGAKFFEGSFIDTYFAEGGRVAPYQEVFQKEVSQAAEEVKLPIAENIEEKAAGIAENMAEVWAEEWSEDLPETVPAEEIKAEKAEETGEAEIITATLKSGSLQADTLNNLPFIGSFTPFTYAPNKLFLTELYDEENSVQKDERQPVS